LKSSSDYLSAIMASIRVTSLLNSANKSSICSSI
jgi:hypothetical protein